MYSLLNRTLCYHEVDGFDYNAIHIFCLDEGGIAAYARLLPEYVKYPGALNWTRDSQTGQEGDRACT